MPDYTKKAIDDVIIEETMLEWPLILLPIATQLFRRLEFLVCDLLLNDSCNAVLKTRYHVRSGTTGRLREIFFLTCYSFAIFWRHAARTFKNYRTQLATITNYAMTDTISGVSSSKRIRCSMQIH